MAEAFVGIFRGQWVCIVLAVRVFRGVFVWRDFFVSTNEETSKHCLLANLQPSCSSLFIVTNGGIISAIFQVFELPFTSVCFKNAYRLMIHDCVFSPYSTRYGSVLKWRDSPKKDLQKRFLLTRITQKVWQKLHFSDTPLVSYRWFNPGQAPCWGLRLKRKHPWDKQRD